MARREESKVNSSKMYLGPTFYGIIQKGTVFSGGVPPKAADLVKENPFLGGLIVPVERLAEARMELKREGSVMQMLYCRALDIGGVRNV